MSSQLTNGIPSNSSDIMELPNSESEDLLRAFLTILHSSIVSKLSNSHYAPMPMTTYCQSDNNCPTNQGKGGC